MKSLIYTEQFLQTMRMSWCNENGIAQIELVAQEGCNISDGTVCSYIEHIERNLIN